MIDDDLDGHPDLVQLGLDLDLDDLPPVELPPIRWWYAAGCVTYFAGLAGAVVWLAVEVLT